MKRTCLSVVALLVIVIASFSKAGPPLPGYTPKVTLQEAIKLIDGHFKKRGVDPTEEQFIRSAVLMHRDNARDGAPIAVGYYWDIQWSMKRGGVREPRKLKSSLRIEVDMNGRVYDRS